MRGRSHRQAAATTRPMDRLSEAPISALAGGWMYPASPVSRAPGAYRAPKSEVARPRAMTQRARAGPGPMRFPRDPPPPPGWHGWPARVPVTPPVRAGVREPPREAEHFRPDIEGLRGLAILMVVMFHAVPGLLGGGYIGVDVFF